MHRRDRSMQACRAAHGLTWKGPKAHTPPRVVSPGAGTTRNARLEPVMDDGSSRPAAGVSRRPETDARPASTRGRGRGSG